MGLKFAVGWNQEGLSEGISGLNTEAHIRSLFTNARQMLINKDATNGTLLQMANGTTSDVWVTKGFHQDTQVSYNPRDKDRSSNLHLTVRMGMVGQTRHVYVVTTATGYRIREIT